MRFSTVFLLFAIFYLFTPRLTAQIEMRGWEVGGWVGTAFYLGDLNTEFRFNRPGPAFGIAGRYNFNHRIAVRGSLNYGQVNAEDNDSDNIFERNRNLSFRSRTIDFTTQLEFNFLPYYHGSPDYPFSPYAFVGVSLFNFNPRTRVRDDIWVDLQPLRTEGVDYSTFATALAYGIGIRWDLSYEWSMDAHVGVRNTSTDYLDDVSTIYPQLDQLDPFVARLSNRSLPPADGSERINRSGTQRGDVTDNDRYLYLGIGVNYYFGDVRCPTIEKGKSKRRFKRNQPKPKKAKRRKG